MKRHHIVGLTAALVLAAPVTQAGVVTGAGDYTLVTPLALYTGTGYPPSVNTAVTKGTLLSASWSLGLDASNKLFVTAVDVMFQLLDPNVTFQASLDSVLTHVGTGNQYELTVYTANKGHKVNLDFVVGSSPYFVTSFQNGLAYTSIDNVNVPYESTIQALAFTPAINNVPEPTALALVSIALAALALRSQRKHAA